MADKQRKSECVLVADSDVLVRHAISDYLRHCGYIVIEAASADEAVVILERENHAVNAVLADIQIAGSMNGFQLKAWLRTRRPDVHIVLSGSTEGLAENAADMCDEGPQLRRPYEPQAVTDYIKRLLAKATRET